MYKIVKPFIFLSDPEKAHDFVIKFLQLPAVAELLKIICQPSKYNINTNLFGLNFTNPIGLAAGFDKNGEIINSLSSLGFGFIEIGTITLTAQQGNPKPRIFRLQQDQAIINRMGFNNKGVEEIKKNIKQSKKKTILGINIGKNRNTPNHKAVEDYLQIFKQTYNLGDYFVINVSSPNTPALRDLQAKKSLNNILSIIQNFNQSLTKPKPLLVKISPDLSFKEIDDILDVSLANKLSGIIATNTTINKDFCFRTKSKFIIESGGLSGKPLKNISTEIIKYISKQTNNTLPIIGVGGIMSAYDALEKFEAGASLIQIYTGLIYNGPCFVKHLKKFLNKNKIKHLNL